jgi:hypothetical protein
MPSNGLKIIPVSGKADYRDFIRLPYHLYRQDPHWVPPLYRERWEAIHPSHNPFYQHAKVKLFLAKQNGRTVGRISAQLNHEYEKFHGERVGHFGFFECENNPAVAQSLMRAAEEFLSFHQAGCIQGPFSFSINDEPGLLIKGFEEPLMTMVPYNPPYYADLIEAAGYQKVKDLFGWRYDPNFIPKDVESLAQEMLAKPEVTLRGPDMKNFEKEILVINEIFNSAWSENWGYVPFTPAELKHIAKNLKSFIDPNGIVFVDVAGKPAGMGVAVPNLYELIDGLKGKLFPLGIFKLLWRIKKKKYKSGRILLLGVKKEFRTVEFGALSFLLYQEGLRRYKNFHFEYGDISWTLEDNKVINSTIGLFGAKHSRTFRVYQKEL